MPVGGTARSATINDVAAAAGVSRQTVTRAMNDMRGISADTKQRVLSAARSLGYRPSRFGRGLVKAPLNTLGLVIDDLANPYYPELAAAVIGFAAERGWNVMLADAVHVRDRHRLMTDLAQQVDAIVGYLSLDPVDGSGAAGGDVVELAGLPVVRIDHDDAAGPPRFGAISLDPDAAMVAVAAHLAAVGVRRPVMLDASPPGRASGRARHVAVSLAAHGLACAVWPAGDATVAAGAEGAEDLIAHGPPFDAVVAFNDAVALGVLQTCRRHGVDVPHDVRVVGMDGLSIGTYVTPQLTTLAIDMSEVARHAVELAVGMRLGELPWSGPTVHRRVAHRLVVRESA
ncbi:LacI family DNA-binding transcriptional regulator [uncultured Friedmanniella sp.]|uniref:LacI family DNA-binding transcriptional regulator n=1 Tax=uncultured Friedmanniella sp. TaxID=335381 RepID=UPI0035CAC175